MSYKKSNWVPYDPTLSFEQNVTQGGTTTADKLNNMETGISNNDINKVTDNKDGTEQLNGVQVQPFNKLSDTIGGRNYALNTENLAVVLNGDPNNYVLKIPVNHDIFGNPNIIISYDAVVTNYTGGTFWRLKHSDIDGNYHTMSDSGDSNNVTANGNYHIVYHGSFPSQTSTLDTLSFNTDLNATVTIKNFMLTIGSTQSSYSPAPEDKVNVSDMRKPASDVVGLEDVPQAVVHSELTSGVDLDTVLTPGVYPFIAASFTNYIDEGTYWGYLVVTSEGLIVTQTAYTTGPAQPLYRMKSGSPASWSPWVKMANDYAVAHLSGANNFDTVPTVNNNPLLLASSLPSDLARTGQDTNFTGKLQRNGKDVATTEDVATASNTVLTSANTSISKLLQSSSNNDEDSAVTNSTSDTSNFYYWTE